MATIRRATSDDCAALGTLLDAFNVEFGEETPGSEVLAERLRGLFADGDTIALVAGSAPSAELAGLALMRFRSSLWTSGLECYLAELYVVPALRGNGIGRAIMEAVLETARGEGADYIELNTGESDVAARALYESLGFDNHEGRADGPVCFYYERTL